MIALLAAHPFLWTLILFPVITFLVTQLLKPRSPEEFAAMNPRVAAFLKFVGAVGFNGPKILEAIAQMVTGQVRSAQEERTK